MRVLITGGAGFIGSALIRRLIAQSDHEVLNVDKLTYAATLASLREVVSSRRYTLAKVDICDAKPLQALFEQFDPEVIVHLAAETHVDRSIDGPGEFVRTNIVGTYTLLQEALRHYRRLTSTKKEKFRFHHVSTDEVFGSLGETGYFTEMSPYDPRSPYSASKASSDHMVRAWGHTYDLPILVTNTSNNYGPYQFPEKLIPLMIVKALANANLPVYGKGTNVRDWLYVEDHANALQSVFERGEVGQTYNIGGSSERQNIDVVRSICEVLDEFRPRKDGKSYSEQIQFVPDRPGHDYRYAIDATKVYTKLDWKPVETFDSGIRKTVEWYLRHEDWWRNIAQGTYAGDRLGVLAG